MPADVLGCPPATFHTSIPHTEIRTILRCIRSMMHRLSNTRVHRTSPASSRGASLAGAHCVSPRMARHNRVHASTEQLTGVALDLSLSSPVVAAELELVSKSTPGTSFARVGYHPECEAAINEQIKWVAMT